MEELIKSKDAEITKLLVDNRQLVDELRQCQADKEFVWSLWKRLQVSSPDLTQAISIVMEREREKTEAKDRKVLEILQSKDEEIKKLHEAVTSMKNEKDQFIKSKTALEVDVDTKTVSMQNLEKEIKKLKHHIEKQQLDHQEKSNSYERCVKEMEIQRDDLKIKMAGFLTDIQEMRTKLQTLEDDNETLKERNTNLRNELSSKDESTRKMKDEKESVVSELERVLRDYSHIKTGAADDIRSRDQRYTELKSAYAELSEHNDQQSVLIKQLQDLQSSTKEVLSEQEEAFRKEKKSLQQVNRDLLDSNENLKEKVANLRKENESFKRRIEVQEVSLKESEEELRKAINMATGGHQDYYYRDFKGLESQIEAQRQEIAALQRKLKTGRARNQYSDSPPSGEYMIDHTFSPIIERDVRRQPTRSRSLSPCAQSRQLVMLQKKLKATETKLDDTKQLLELKKDEVREIQRAHNKRLDRLKILQADYRILKSGHSDGETVSPRKRSNKSRARNPKDLRQENSEAVWNELARIKQDAKALSKEKISLEEELDALRVQAAMDRATIHDLNVCLKQEKKEVSSRMRNNHQDEERMCSTPKSREEGRMTSRNVKNLERKLENAAEDNKMLKKDKKRLLQDNKSLKENIKSLKMEFTDTRQNATKLRIENNDLRHQVERFKSGSNRLGGDLSNLKSELEGLREESAALHSENLSLRDENNELRQDVADLKLEISDLTAELKDLDRVVQDTENEQKKKGKSLKCASARKHQKFLNKSVEEMQAAFGSGFSPPAPSSTGEESSMPEDVGRSDASSLGQSIVRESRKQRMAKRNAIDEDKDEDDTMADESADTHRTPRPSARRPASLPRHRDGGMLVTLKHRLSSLQTQCNSLRTAKQNAIKKVNEEKEKNIQLESDLTSCQNKLKNFKQTVQRLNREVDVLQKEREDLQRALADARNDRPDPPLHTDADYKYLESKLKLSNGETSRVNEQLKEVKRELEKKVDALTTEKEKNTRLERDVSMKRQLIDELRVKTKENEGKLKEEFNAKLDIEERLKVVEEDLNHKKKHIDSIRRQLQACTKEKAKYELMYNKAREEIEKRCEQLSSAQASKLEAENTTSRMEQEAEHQLQTLASRSEQALEKLKSKLERSEEKLGEFGVFIQTLSSHLIELLSRQRDNLSREKTSSFQAEAKLSASGDQRSSMSHAQKVACDILNMSRSDFEDLMAPVDASRRKMEEKETEKDTNNRTHYDDTWKAKVEKIATENPPFAKSLSRLMWDKIQDLVRITEEQCRIRTERLEEEILSRKK